LQCNVSTWTDYGFANFNIPRRDALQCVSTWLAVYRLTIGELKAIKGRLTSDYANALCTI